MPRPARFMRFGSTTRLLLMTLLGVLVGAAVGIALQDKAEEASAMIRIDIPTDPYQIIGTLSGDITQRYISGEMAFLSSHGFADDVAKELNQTTTPEFSARQNVQSSVITVSATAATFPDAERTVNAVIKVYTDHVGVQYRERYQAAIDEVDKALDVQSADIEKNATLIGQLEAQRAELELRAQLPPGIQVVQPPVRTPHEFPSTTLGAMAGGLFGGLIALSGMLIWRRYRSETQVAGLAASR